MLSNRRDVLKQGVFLAAAAATFPASARVRAMSAPRRSLRIAHLTDAHIQPELRAGEGVAACLTHLMGQSDKPDLVLTGGDHVMDSFDQENERTTQLWRLWRTVWSDHTHLPVKSCIGNHDIWGWNKEASKTSGSEPNWGKKRAVDELGIPAPYYAFEQGGWKFIILDTVQPTSKGAYEGGLDTTQFEWLQHELEQSGNMPVLVLSHIPIVHAGVLLVKDNGKDREIARGKFCMDALRTVSLFEKHPNVKVCLSGHIHSLERIDLQGVSYLCNGAVCGNWWKGNPKSTAPHVDRATEGYALIDLFDDGTFASAYQTYGWKPQS